MEKSTVTYTVYIMLTVVLYRITTEFIPIIPFSDYMLFFGAEIPVVLVALITIYYNEKAGYSGVVTIGISIVLIIYALLELRLGSFILPSTYVVSLVHWSVGLVLGVVLMHVYRLSRKFIYD